MANGRRQNLMLFWKSKSEDDVIKHGHFLLSPTSAQSVQERLLFHDEADEKDIRTVSATDAEVKKINENHKLAYEKLNALNAKKDLLKKMQQEVEQEERGLHRWFQENHETIYEKRNPFTPGNSK